MAFAPCGTVAANVAVDLCRVPLCGLDCGAGRLDCDRGRSPALAGHRNIAHRRCGRPYFRRRTRRQPHRLCADLQPDAAGVLRGDYAHGRQGRGTAGGAEMNIDLPMIFAVLMGISILAYVVLDGYDLGVGMLMPAATPDEQNLMVASIGPFWDANETWLVLGIGILLVAFPVAHGGVLGALYLPVAAMRVGLMFRGVAFEFRMKALGWHAGLWNWLFWFGSFVASLAQGFMLGRYITGFEPGAGYWLFAFIVGGSVCGGYVL